MNCQRYQAADVGLFSHIDIEQKLHSATVGVLAKAQQSVGSTQQ
ncbi:MAG TPA: hypothetical protein VF682_21075 [Pseudomonas sp.]|jgi:hypothetical protein